MSEWTYIIKSTDKFGMSIKRVRRSIWDNPNTFKGVYVECDSTGKHK